MIHFSYLEEIKINTLIADNDVDNITVNFQIICLPIHKSTRSVMILSVKRSLKPKKNAILSYIYILLLIYFPIFQPSYTKIPLKLCKPPNITNQISSKTIYLKTNIRHLKFFLILWSKVSITHELFPPWILLSSIC